MKKEAISVLKPHNGKQSKTKVGKNTKENAGKVQKKDASPRGPNKPTIINVQKVSNVDKIKNLKGIKSKPVIQSEIKNLVEKKGKYEKKTHSANDAPTTGKMAAVKKVPVTETRAQSKKKVKIETDAKPVVPVKKVKKESKEKVQATVKTEIKGKAEKTIKNEIKQKPEKKVKNEIKQKPEKKVKNEKIVKKEKIIKATAETVVAAKKPKKKVKKNIAKTGDLKLTKEHVLKTIESVIKLTQKKDESKKSLLPTDSTPIHLQVTCVKVADTPRRQIRPLLPNSISGPLDDVALFVPDIVKGRKQDYEKTVDHWETLLRKKGVTCIKEIIPINRVKTEYGQFELKRKLAASFDHFLADGRIIGHLTHLLGKAFLSRKDSPTPVKLERSNLKEEIDTALRKTCMEIHKFGNSHSMPIGTISMDKNKLVENVWAACESLAKEYPGGWENIRAIRVKGQLGLSIPIFLNLASKNTVKKPVVKPKRPRAYETVEGELTTIPGKTSVKVTPEGRITLKRERDDVNDVKKEEIAEESDQDESEDEAEEVEEESEDED